MDKNIAFEQVKKLVIEASEILKSNNIDKETALKSDGSLITKYDYIMDNKIKEGLNKIINCPILSEEHEEEIGNTYFVVDPIDGTGNFNIDFDMFCVMVAYVENNITEFSVIYIPRMDKLYTAIKGQGAFLNGKPIKVKENGNWFDGLGRISLDELDAMKKILETHKEASFRIIGSSGIAYSLVADGTFDFYYTTLAGGPWDILPGKLIVEEAGGVVKLFDFKNFQGVKVASKEAMKSLEELGL